MQNNGNMIGLATPEFATKDRPSDDHKAKQRARVVIELVLTVDVPTSANDPSSLRGQVGLRLSRFDL